MIACPVCGAGNRELAVICTSCHGFLQSRADALDLFSTIWETIERPSGAFRKVALATHKNYSILLASSFGTAWLFMAMRMGGIADQIPNLFLLLLGGLILGPPCGIAGILLLSLVVLGIGRGMGGEGTLRNIFAVIAYATVPLSLALVFVLPVELGIFGKSLFSTALPASALKPTIAGMLMGIHAAAFLWFVSLMLVGTGVVHSLGKMKGLVMSLLSSGIVVASLLLLPASAP